MTKLGGLSLSKRNLSRLGLYAALMGGANLIWEIAHLPLYTLWESPDLGEKIFAVLHCTLGDVMIALTTLLIALLLFGHPDWPARHWAPVALVTIALGIAYTVFSEWLNISIRQSWAYRDLMPVLPPLGTGLSPLLQWLVLPWLCLWSVRRSTLSSNIRSGGKT